MSWLPKYTEIRNWRIGSVVKSAHCSYRRPGLDFQHLYGSPQGPGTLPTSKRSCTYGAHTYTEAHSHIHIKINKVIFRKCLNIEITQH